MHARREPAVTSNISCSVHITPDAPKRSLVSLKQQYRVLNEVYQRKVSWEFVPLVRACARNVYRSHPRAVASLA